MAVPVNSLEQECLHGLIKRTCEWCMGKLRTAPYRQALAAAKLIPADNIEVKTVRRDCELCARRKPCKGNRVTVRLPRPPRSAWGTNVPDWAPTFMGPCIEAPRIYKATHRLGNGSYSCDRCDPSWNTRPERHNPEGKTREVRTAMDIFA